MKRNMATLQIKPFPWKCPRCRKRTVRPSIQPFSHDMEHDGRTYSIHIPDLEMPSCSDCGVIIRDDLSNARICAALRQAVGLLSPEQMRENREALGLTQKEFAKLLGIAESTVSRWETGGQIQQRSLDRLMRLFFALPEVRRALRIFEDDLGMRDLGISVLPTASGSASGSNQELQAVKIALQKVMSSCQDALRLSEAR